MKPLAVFALTLCPLAWSASDALQPYARSARPAQHHDTSGPRGGGGMFDGFMGSPGANACRAGGWRGLMTLRYDALADRWVTARTIHVPAAGLSYLCIAVAASKDPAGRYHRYVFELTQANGAPASSRCGELQPWPDAYYFSHLLADPTSEAYLGPQVCGYEREAMLAGMPAEGRCVDFGPSFGPLRAMEMPESLRLAWRFSFTTHTISMPLIVRADPVRTCTSG